MWSRGYNEYMYISLQIVFCYVLVIMMVIVVKLYLGFTWIEVLCVYELMQPVCVKINASIFIAHITATKNSIFSFTNKNKTIITRGSYLLVEDSPQRQ